MGYIVPVDAPNPNSDPTGFKKKAIPMQQFDTWAKGIEARHALFLFDSCFSGSIFNVTRAVPDNIGEKTMKAVRQFITSGSAEEQVPDKSIFRDQFIAGISGEADRGGDGYVTGAELGEFLDERVVNYSKKSQHPQYGKIQDPDLDKGDFVFAVPASATAGSRTVGESQPSSPKAQKVEPGIQISATYGSLVVSAAEQGTLYLNGSALVDLRGGAKKRLDNLETGEHRLEIRYAGGANEVQDVLIEEGAVASLAFAWKPVTTGSLVVTTDPSGATISVNGIERGKSPLTLGDLNAGYATVIAQREGYIDTSQQKLIEVGKTTELAWTLGKKALAIGDTYAGGIVFYLNGKGGGLVAAPSDQSGSTNWDSAKKLCEDLVLNGFSDWRLPTKNELSRMYTNLKKKGRGGFGSTWYWSSGEDLAGAWGHGFGNGGQDSYNKSNASSVRAVRAFTN